MHACTRTTHNACTNAGPDRFAIYFIVSDVSEELAAATMSVSSLRGRSKLFASKRADAESDVIVRKRNIADTTGAYFVMNFIDFLLF